MNNILIIDDSGLMRLKTRKILENGGYQVFEAENGQQVKIGSFSSDLSLKEMDLILLDKNLKEENGLDLLIYLTEKHPNLPVIMVSVEGSKEIFMKAIDLGAKDFIVKPIKKEALLTKIKSLLPSDQDITVLEYNSDAVVKELKNSILKEVERAIRSDEVFSILKFIIKDEISKEILREMRYIMNNKIRNIDQLFSVSENTFIFLLPLTNEKGVEVFLEKIKSDFKGCDIGTDVITFPQQECELKHQEKDLYFNDIINHLEVI